MSASPRQRITTGDDRPPASGEGRTAADEKAIRKVAFAALGGTSIEWYDFFLYGTAAALVFPAVFFPADMPPLVALLASFGTFAVGFIARPIGGVLFGHFGDRLGRKKTLVVALLLMGAATTLIGCLPGHAQIGPAAAVVLTLLRFAQGLAIGGQWAGAVLLVTESAPAGRRGFYGSFAQVGAPVGVILANLAFLVVTSTFDAATFMSWGWRLPFLSSVVLIALALYVQLRLEETAAFRELDSKRASAARNGVPTPVRASPVIEALRAHWRWILLAAGAFMAVQVTFYILIAFAIAYGTSASGLGLPQDTMLTAVLIGAIVMVPALLSSAAASDRYGRKPVYIAGAVLLGAWAFALFPLMATRELLWISFAIAMGQIFVGMMYGPQAAFLSEMFGTELRYSAASLGYQLGAIAGGAVAPLVATAILARYGDPFGISVYIAIACLITVVSTLKLPETRSARTAAVEARGSADIVPPDARRKSLRANP